MITKTPGCEGLRERAMKRTGALKNIQQVPALNPKPHSSGFAGCKATSNDCSCGLGRCTLIRQAYATMVTTGRP